MTTITFRRVVLMSRMYRRPDWARSAYSAGTPRHHECAECDGYGRVA